MLNTPSPEKSKTSLEDSILEVRESLLDGLLQEDLEDLKKEGVPGTRGLTKYNLLESFWYAREIDWHDGKLLFNEEINGGNREFWEERFRD